MKRTISIAKGKGSIGHNSRDFKAENVDPDRVHLNTCYINEDIKEVYHKLFDDALQKYNDKQKRSDRKIDDYYEKIRVSKQEKLFYEIIVQVGDFEDMNAVSNYGKMAETILHKYMADFQERNPTLYVFSAHLHMDEATPHLHIDFVPYTDGNKRGLGTKNTLKGALEKLGFTGGTRSDTELNQWQNSEKEVVAKIMLEHGIEWEKKGTHEKKLSDLNYKKKMRIQEVEKLEEQLVESEEAVANLKAEISKNKQELTAVKTKKTKVKKVDEIPVKTTLLDSNKITVSKDDFEDVKTLAKKQIVSENKEKKLIAENTSLKQENNSLHRQNNALTSELNQHKSIKNRMQSASVEAELSNLKRLLNKVYEFVEKVGLKAQLEKFLNQKIDKVR